MNKVSEEILKHEILIKIIVTIIVSIITWAFLKFVDRVIIPYAKRLFYTGKNISGIWIGTVESSKSGYEKMKYHEHLELKQSSNKLTGKYTVKNENEDKTSTVSIYTVTGEIVNSYVTLTCSIKGKREIGVTNFLLQLSSGGDDLIGQTLWVNRSGTEILHHGTMAFKYQKK